MKKLLIALALFGTVVVHAQPNNPNPPTPIPIGILLGLGAILGVKKISEKE